MGVYDDQFGSILIGSWLASILFGLVLDQSFQYFTMHPKDTIARKGIVVSSLLFCIAAVVADYANTYLPTVTFWGDTERVQKQYWPVPMYVTMNTCAGVIVNSFLIHRVYALSKNIVICMLLCAFVILGVTGSILVAITVHIFSAFAARDKAEISALIWLISTATAGTYIHRCRPDLATTIYAESISSCRLINRLIIQTVQTGSTTSLISIATLVSYIIKKDSNVPTALCYLIGPLYLLTLFSNLNHRRPDNISGSGRSTSEGHSAVRMDGIHVHRAAIVTVDADQRVAQV
ncbi:hypothetical protein K438DRAFT_1998535 [Mycena galopus ATCC 62051]|nr:hypothetical protein K438DRAFT_1998535 [Mycena galopus ATCC 62051]